MPTPVLCQPSTLRIQQIFPSGDHGCPLTLQMGNRAPQGCTQHQDGLLPSPLPLPLQETVTSHALGWNRLPYLSLHGSVSAEQSQPNSSQSWQETMPPHDHTKGAPSCTR